MSKRKRLEGSSIMDFFTSPRHSHSTTHSSSLISFYDGSGTDNRGRYLSDIMRWGANKLESSHDYIQTLFPLPERSGVNDRAPTIDRQVFEAFRARTDLRDNLREAFQKMLWFYGFELSINEEDGKMIVKKAQNHTTHFRNWLTRFDHNHLRITRIIRSLRVLGLQDEAVAFYEAISTATIVSARSRTYWERAAHRPLNIKPDVDDEDVDEERMGPKFLREFEESKREQHQQDQAACSGTGAAVTRNPPHVENALVEESKKPENESMKPCQKVAENEETDTLNGGTAHDIVNGSEWKSELSSSATVEPAVAENVSQPEDEKDTQEDHSNKTERKNSRRESEQLRLLQEL